jgi:tetratricopeptide (TPR) repeat protein
MALRKEQVLLLAVAGIGVLLWNGWRGGELRAVVFQPKKKDHTAVAVRPVPLAPTGGVPRVRKNLASEPGETQPLPPRELPFPARAPLAVIGLPLEVGPDLAHTVLLRMPGGIVEGVSLQPAAAPAAAGGEIPEQPGSETPAQKRERWSRVYDQVFLEGRSVPLLGVLEIQGMDRFEAETRKELGGVSIRLRHFSIEKEQFDVVLRFNGPNEDKAVQVRLANNLGNEVARRIRRVPEDGAHLPERAELLEWLLDKAREEPSIYDKALEQAAIYFRDSGQSQEGVQWQVRVLRSKGDLAGALALLQGLKGNLENSSYQLTALGALKALLGLDQDAEALLRRGVEAGPSDPLAHAALARFLLQRGRSREAAAPAQRAFFGIGSLTTSAYRLEVGVTVVGCRLALGDVKEARAALDALGEPNPYLRACIDYASGDHATALAGFRQAQEGVHAQPAQLGAAACLLQAQQWAEALAAFEAVAEQAPLRRSRALCGIALLYLRLGQFDQTLTYCERALEADPLDAYAFYLRGRALRLQGQLQQAATALSSALKLRDDFVHAVAEMAEVKAATARDSRGEEQAVAALAAMRYADRAVRLASLASMPLPELHELQGVQHFAAGDLAGAATAFAAARDLAKEDQKQFARGALAVVDYAQGRTDEASVQLAKLRELPKDHPVYVWAQATQLLIDDHSQKEVLVDHFERSGLGNVWDVDPDGTLLPEIEKTVVGNTEHSQIRLRGRFSRGEVAADRVGAVLRAQRFLAVSGRLQLGSSHQRADTFAGLRIATVGSANNTQVDFRAEIGIRDGKPFLRIDERNEEPFLAGLTVPGFDAAAAHEVGFRVVPRGEGRQWQLLCLWNDQVVLARDLKTLGAGSSLELRTGFLARGPKGAEVDVRFDDYELERRREAIQR